VKPNSQLVKDRFVHAQQYLNEVALVLEHPLDEYMKDLGLQLKAERLFEVLSQIILDICTHLVSREKTADPPKSYGDCMLLLEDMGVLDKANGEGAKFQTIIKMRNFIVHDYARIDNKVVYTSLEQLAEDFPLYQKRVLTWLSQTSNKK
jgi:uncharacterized protein YutE (UPF0331/DUF86 family)